MERQLWQRALRAPPTTRLAATQRPIPILHPQFIRQASSVPTVAQPAFWKSLIPKPWRPREKSTIDWGTPPTKLKKPPKSKEWNPATYFIVIFLFIGSMSIQMIALRRDFATFTRRAEVRIGLLREVVEKLQKGEAVDVEKTLGTGDAEQEQAWDEILKAIERDDKNARKAERTKQSPSTSERIEPEADSTPAQGTDQAKAKAASYSSFF
ncbi:Uu.00g058510.m01.CDS01 [Anthostomella pinea]|uniref:Uu.00g058510.m01.CDS01 n=1 Tax=Anthostomella pinea TaxID=933095 RepID=A0AAI8VRY4_9PEZI|nr:Uu.00g058510.m01.CDS01 [Anthostomella pinea]